MDVRELIKRGYRAVGLGADDDLLALFDQLGGEPAEWVVYEVGAFGRPHPAKDVVALELFSGLPSHFEVIAETAQVGGQRGPDAGDPPQFVILVSGHARHRTTLPLPADGEKGGTGTGPAAVRARGGPGHQRRATGLRRAEPVAPASPALF